MTITAQQALAALPAGLRQPLLNEYRSIVSHYLEHSWSPSELSGGMFCEIVYTILDGFAVGTYPVAPSKPPDFVGSCRKLEKHTHVPRSFQILIPRLLPALYEIRNNRGVGHVGGDVDPNHMDATAVLGMANWVMAELVRVLHQLNVSEAQGVVDALAERRIPIVWERDGMRRVLRTDLGLQDQILLLASTSATSVSIEDLSAWTDYSDKGYMVRLLRKLHKERKIEFTESAQSIVVLPPGTVHVEAVLLSLQD